MWIWKKKKKGGDEDFQDKVFGEIQELKDTTPEELRILDGDSAEPMPDEDEDNTEEAAPENWC